MTARTLLTAVLASLLLIAHPAAADTSLAITPDDKTLTVSWPAVAGATEYRITRDGAAVATVAGSVRSWTDTGVTNGTTHAYTVAALVNGAVTQTTGALRATAVDLRPPGQVNDPVVVQMLDGGVNVYWSASYDVAQDAGAYHLYVDGHLAGIAAGGRMQGKFSVAGLVNEAQHVFEVEVVDRLGNLSRRRSSSNSAFDLEPPAAPINLRVDVCSGSSVTLSWDTLGGTGGDASVEYEVRRDGQTIATEVQDTTYRAQGLTAGVPTKFSVVAADAAGASSNPSLELSVTPTDSGAFASAKQARPCLVSTPDRPPVPPAPALDVWGDSVVTPATGTVVDLTPAEPGTWHRYAGYRLYRDGQLLRTASLRPNAPYVAVPLHDGTTRVEAELIDLHGQTSPRSSLPVSAVTQLLPGEPTQLTASGTTVTWQPPTGQTPAGYEVSIDGQPALQVTQPTATLPATSAPTLRTIRVATVDGAGRRSLPSAPLLVTS